MAESLKLLIPSWDELYALLTELARNIRTKYEPEVIIGISRGGLIPARVLTDLLDVPVMGTICVAFYEDVGQRMKYPTITQPLSVSVENKRVLVVDDVADTGESLGLVVGEIKEHVQELRTAAVFRKPWARFVPDFSAQVTDAWVVYPWELRETIKKISKRLLDSSMKPSDASNRLILAGFDRRLVLTVLEDLGGDTSS